MAEYCAQGLPYWNAFTDGMLLAVVVVFVLVCIDRGLPK